MMLIPRLIEDAEFNRVDPDFPRCKELNETADLELEAARELETLAADNERLTKGLATERLLSASIDAEATRFEDILTALGTHLGIPTDRPAQELGDELIARLARADLAEKANGELRQALRVCDRMLRGDMLNDAIVNGADDPEKHYTLGEFIARSLSHSPGLNVALHMANGDSK